MWPGIWFLEGGEEIDLQEGGYTEGQCSASAANRCMAVNYHGVSNDQRFYDTGVDLSAGYHIYGMEYKPGVSSTMHFDGKQVAR